jgi:hypothetical protein
VPRRLSAPLDLSFHLQPHLDVSYLTDNAAWTRTPCSRRHGRRPSAAVPWRPMTITTRPFLPLPRHDARQLCHDVAHTPSPLLAPSSPWNDDVVDDLARTLAAPLASIKAGSPWTISPHPRVPLSPLSLLVPSSRSITHRSPPIHRRSPRRS